MAIKRYHANADNTITNAFKADLSTRGTGSNMGAADVLEVFSIYGQASGSTARLSSELTRSKQIVVRAQSLLAATSVSISRCTMHPTHRPYPKICTLWLTLSRAVGKRAQVWIWKSTRT